MGDGEDEPFVPEAPCKCKGSLKIHWSCFQELGNRTQLCSMCHSPFIYGSQVVTIYHSPGRIKEKYFMNVHTQLRHGKYVSYYPNGQVNTMGYYYNGARHRKFEQFYASGRIALIAFYAGDIKHGSYEVFYDQPNSQLKSSATYSYNALHGVETKYYANGVIKTETTYHLGNRDGPFQSFYPSGAPDVKTTYVTNKYDGPFIKYYANGVLAIKGMYSYGVKTDDFIKYNKDGEVVADK